MMPSAPDEPVDLLDLKLLPAWLKEPSDSKAYAHYQGEEEGPRPRDRDGDGRQRRPKSGRDANSRGPKDRDLRRGASRTARPKARPHANRPPTGRNGDERRFDDRERGVQALQARVNVRFLANPRAFENVAAQIKSNPVAYSVFYLARLFLEKPERYDVHLAAIPGAPLYQLGENGPVSADQQFLESNAFRFAQADFYKIEVTQSEPIKGNFSSVARCRASGTLLGPTNHHNYQPRLRTLYEQRFSRRMSFPEYQRQIESVSDPAVVEQWKEEARSLTTFTALKEEPAATFSNAAEAERHFRQHYLPGLVREVQEQIVGGVASRQLPDQVVRRLVEDAWSKETRSPAQVMQELSTRFREAGLHIFRHRRGMLFVTSVRTRPFAHEQANVSSNVQAIFQTLGDNPGLNRKDLADRILAHVPAEDTETRKLGLASDLRWLISEGYLLEFNDGSLDLPRVKANTGAGKPAEVVTRDSALDAAAPAGESEPAPAANGTPIQSVSPD